MSRRDRDTALSALSLLIVAALVVSPAGAALRGALSAQNAGKVGGIPASKAPKGGHLVPLDARGKLPRSTVTTRPQRRGPSGEPGPAGLLGATGSAGLDGPEWAELHSNAKSYVAQPSGPTVVAAARNLPPGTYLVLGQAHAKREITGYRESLAVCFPSNGAERGINPGIDVGFNKEGLTGETEGTVLAFGVFTSSHAQDITLSCAATTHDPAPTFSDPRLIVARVPSAWAQAAPQEVP